MELHQDYFEERPVSSMHPPIEYKHFIELCDEIQPAVNVPETPASIGNMNLLIRNLGTTPSGETISLIIRNETEGILEWLCNHVFRVRPVMIPS